MDRDIFNRANSTDSANYPLHAVVAFLLTFFLGPLGAFISWWLLGGLGFGRSLIRTLAYLALFAFCFGLLFMAFFMLSAWHPAFAVSMVPLGICIYIVLQIVILISVVKAALHPEDEHA